MTHPQSNAAHLQTLKTMADALETSANRLEVAVDKLQARRANRKPPTERQP